MLHKPNHAHQDDLWLPLSEENSSTFLCQVRLGSWPQTLDPLLTPGFPWAHCQRGWGERDAPAWLASARPAGLPSGRQAGGPSGSLSERRMWSPPSPATLVLHPKATGPLPLWYMRLSKHFYMLTTT